MSIENGKKNERGNVPKIVQIIPCNVEMYAVTDEEDGGKFKNRVLMFALCDNGEVYPLHFDSWLGVFAFCDAALDASEYEMDGGEVYLPPEQEGGERNE